MSKIHAVHMDKFNSLQEFRAAIQKLTDQGLWPLVMWEDELSFTAVPAEAAKEMICREVVDRWAENPQILNDLQFRLENEKPEDWD